MSWAQKGELWDQNGGASPKSRSTMRRMSNHTATTSDLSRQPERFIAAHMSCLFIYFGLFILHLGSQYFTEKQSLFQLGQIWIPLR